MKYWSKIGVAALKINTRQLSLGDEIYIIGKDTGIVRVKIDRMEIEHKSINKVKKGMMVGIKVPKCHKGDEVFLIEKLSF